MLTDKKLSKIEKALGTETLQILNQLGTELLKDTIAKAEGSVKTAHDELDSNEKYQGLKESVKDMQAGLSEVKKRQNSIVQYCLHLLEEIEGAK